ncbi:MAG TPA: N-acetyl-gamma-glutamyl-phosphate reductase [Acidimicrobiales bacterium]|nr:N-acetyl-gamma-glutamyl-phosphate reductase [Acidimicrobiales bacterium]
MAFRVGIAGASGYTGVELLRLCAAHPAIEVMVATGDSAAGAGAAEIHPSLAAAYPDLRFAALDGPATFDGLDLVFLCLPHGRSQELVPGLRTRVGHIVDLGADFRLKDAGLYPTWYGHAHTCPELLEEFAFGIPELFREPLRGAPLIAAAGCYVTSAALALAPLVRAGAVVAEGIVVDAASGVSGAGRAPTATTHFGSVNESFRAYGLLDHRHTPEIEQAVGAQVLFTPHLAPMTRGLLSTCYARPTDRTATTDDLIGLLADFYADEPFVVVGRESPSTKATLGANTAMITARVDPRTGWVVVLSALDNLVKGASGQMVQCANLALGLEETTGLPLVGVTP